MKNKSGEIGLMLVTIILLLSSSGIGIGFTTQNNKPINKFSKALTESQYQTQSCLYTAIAEVRLHSSTGPLLTISENENYNFGVSNDKQYITNSLTAAGQFGTELKNNVFLDRKINPNGNNAYFTYHTDSFSFNISNENNYNKGDLASVRLIGLNSAKYEIIGKYCNGTGCPQILSDQEQNTTIISGFKIDCGLNLTYGWIVKEKQIISTPTPNPLVCNLDLSIVCAPKNLHAEIKDDNEMYITWSYPNTNDCPGFQKKKDRFWIDIVDTKDNSIICSRSANDEDTTCKLERDQERQIDKTVSRWENQTTYIVAIYTANNIPGCIAGPNTTLIQYSNQPEPTLNILPTDIPTQKCNTIGELCEDTYSETCFENGKQGTRKCYKYGRCQNIGDGTQCSWESPRPEDGEKSYCEPCQTEQNTCGKSCVYSQNENGITKCYIGNCKDGSNTCSTNINCGYVNGCSSGRETSCSGNATPQPTNPVPTGNQNDDNKQTKKVTFIKFNTYLQTKNKKLFDYHAPLVNPDNLVQDVRNRIYFSSNNLIDYQITNTIDYNQLPPLKNESNLRQYEIDMLSCLNNHPEPENEGKVTPTASCEALKNNLIDYQRLFSTFNICQKVNRGLIDEIWVMVSPYVAFGEDDMVGPNPFNINGKTHVLLECNKNVPILGIDMTRTADLALHSYGHRIERTMEEVYGALNQYNPSSSWDYFANAYKYAWEQDRPNNKSIYGCGTVHFPFNTQKNYGYDDSKIGSTYCDTFKNYDEAFNPNNIILDQNNCNKFECNQMGYMSWWMMQIPHFKGTDALEKNNNWWSYIGNPEAAIQASSVSALQSVDYNSDNVLNAFDYAYAINNIEKKQKIATELSLILQYMDHPIKNTQEPHYDY